MSVVCTVKNLSVKLRLQNVSCTIYKNDFIVVLGSNGSGKTTMLKVLDGTITKYSGSVNILSSITKGSITQNTADSLFMEFSLLQNFHMYMDAFNSKNKDLKKFLELLKSVNSKLPNLMESKASALSGGERQSFLLGLNLFFEHSLLLLDEHTSALDPKTAHEVMDITARNLKGRNITCIMTTHSLDDAIKYGNRLIAMQHGEILKTFEENEKKQLSKADLLEYCY